MKRVFVAGDLNVDMLLYLNGMPPLGEERHARSISFSIGGNAANFATALGKLGVGTEFYSCIGNDFASEYLTDQLNASGVNMMLKKCGCPNGYTACFVLPDGERTLVSNKGASGTLSVGDLDGLMERIMPGDILYIGGLFHLPELCKSMGDFMGKAKKKGATVMLDFTFDSMGCSEYFRDFVKQIDYLFLNEDETKRLGRGDLEKSLHRIHEMGVSHIVTKLGRRGAVYYDGTEIRKQPGFRTEVVDSTGAGDVFNAAFVYGYLEGLEPEQCLRLGNMVGSFKVGRTGIQVPDPEAVSKFMKDNGEMK